LLLLSDTTTRSDLALDNILSSEPGTPLSDILLEPEYLAYLLDHSR
jgi:hypothetical protein